MASKQSLTNKRVLITSGPTWVAIDDMRVISNKSSGRLGQLLAEKCLKAKAKVTLIEGPVANPTAKKGITTIPFCYYDELNKALKSELKKRYDIVIHAAAVSDYKLKRPLKSKISSELKRLSLQLVPTAKIIRSIKKISPKTFLVGFKLGSDVSRENAQEMTRSLFAQSKCDIIVANSLKSGYHGFIVNKRSEILAETHSRKETAKELIKTIKKAL